MEEVGSQEIEAYIKKYNLKPDKEVVTIMQSRRYQKKPWTSYINSSNERLCSKEAIDLLSKMLVVDHNERITAE